MKRWLALVAVALAAGVVIGSGTRPDPIGQCVILPSLCDPASPLPPEPVPPPPSAELTLTTASGQTRTSETLPYRDTLTIPAGGGDVVVSAAADDTDTLTCAISVDGREVARQQVARGVVTCRATM